MSAPSTSHRLATSGADLYYEVRGSGPLLLVIGQPMTSGPFGPVAELLAEHHTVVTYDPHGLGRSTVDDPSIPISPEVQAEDLAHLVDAVGGGPADVFGTSGGAVAGLALAARYPHLVRTLIAHEPPVVELLPDARYVRAAVDDIVDAYSALGGGAAWAKFVSLVMHEGMVTEAGVSPAAWSPPEGHDTADTDAVQPPPDQTDPQQTEKQQADDALFFLRMLPPFTLFQPDVEALRAGGPRTVVAVGEASREEVARRSAEALAERLGTAAVTLPGDHVGFMADPPAFAQRLVEVLATTAASSTTLR